MEKKPQEGSSLLRQYEEQFGVVSADLVSKIGELRANPSRKSTLPFLMSKTLHQSDLLKLEE